MRREWIENNYCGKNMRLREVRGAYRLVDGSQT